MVDGGSSIDILMDSDDMSGPRDLIGELLVTVTLEPVHLAQVILLMFNEELLWHFLQSFVSRRIWPGLEVFPATLTSDHFVDFVMAIQGFLVIICKAAALTPGPIITSRDLVSGLTLTVWAALSWRSNWMLETVWGIDWKYRKGPLQRIRSWAIQFNLDE